MVELGSASAPELVRWSTTWHPGQVTPFDSYALRTADGWVLIDPEALELLMADDLRRLIRGPVVATVLTSNGHERACYAVRERWGTPVWAPVAEPPAGGVAYEGTPEHLYSEGTHLPGGLRPVRLSGMWGGDHALLWRAPSGARVLFTGDVLNGQVEVSLLATAPDEHYRARPGLYFGARPNYVGRHPDPSALERGLRRLLEEEDVAFDVVCGAHGRPFRDDPQAALLRLLEAL